MQDRLRSLWRDHFQERYPAYEIGGVLVPKEVEGFIEPTKNTLPTFTPEKWATIRNSLDNLLAYYASHNISNLPQTYPFSSRWNTARYEYRGMLLADLFVASFVTEGKITGGTIITDRHRRLSSGINTTIDPVEAKRYAQAKALEHHEEEYAAILGLGSNEQNKLYQLKQIQFFKPVVVEFDNHKRHKDTPRERRRGTRYAYTKTQPYLFMDELSDRCLEQLQQATGFNFVTGRYVEERPLE